MKSLSESLNNALNVKRIKHSNIKMVLNRIRN